MRKQTIHVTHLAKYPVHSAKLSKESVKSKRSYGIKFKHWLTIDIAKVTGG